MDRNSNGRKNRLPKAAGTKSGIVGSLTSKGGMIATVVSVAALGLTAAATLGVTSFSAQVGGTGTFQSGTLLLSDTNGSGTCLSSANSAGSITTNINAACAGSDLGAGTTNKPGGVAQTSNVTLTNQGSIASVGGLTLVLGACSAAVAPFGASVLNPLSSGTDTSAGLCGKVLVTIFSTTSGNCLFPAGAGACPAPSHANGTLTTLVAASPFTLAASLAAGASQAIVITTQLDNAAGTGATNIDQGMAASMTMTYTLAQ